ncbi:MULTISPECIES: putative quinol monooxygenase [unclassified Streptomyces]|uniref:putative quinol monooxygenase n=1 Tax=Streptomyces TaxID=1883 RepID=UPI0001C1A286|nr:MULTISPECIES: putative quinol monooxygenase [unclassified Streptomyces]AEN13844.1 Antibiotic biosynthesis monooxygenase [Streptomyces sp. SirexAA-E]MYR67924.1 antibiotic biosynthesis monooxygenase [Streptomyces sp. SID4939]MYS01607.1 antibiotic biosynthesis monooxygenase [Streptomyces sp. SID4940]MYT67733.1 antibiotic biosynthesis monooxygenase [Streptomyces sp. SID8357]MYT86577.1 antibiotic biosynthesis monooxygenase [Streptomyces sp. SID8360]
MAFAVIAHYRCAPEDEATVRAALLRTREHTRAEPGNLGYEVHAEVDRPGSFVLYERYADRSGFDAHAAAGYFDELIVRTVRPLLTERTVTFAEVL